jgi:hypothetical protein
VNRLPCISKTLRGVVNLSNANLPPSFNATGQEESTMTDHIFKQWVSQQRNLSRITFLHPEIDKDALK